MKITEKVLSVKIYFSVTVFSIFLPIFKVSFLSSNHEALSKTVTVNSKQGE